MNGSPSTNGPGGRDDRGRFARGNRIGNGNPLGGKVARLRAALIDAIDEQHIMDIVGKLIEQAKAGDVAATKLLLTYTLGQPLPADILERIEQLEQAQ